MTIEDNIMPDVGPIRIGEISLKNRLIGLANEFCEYISGLGANVSPLIPEMIAQMKTIPNSRKSYAQGEPVSPMTLISNQRIIVSLEDY